MYYLAIHVMIILLKLYLMVFIQVFKNNKAPGTNIKYKKEVNYSYL